MIADPSGAPFGTPTSSVEVLIGLDAVHCGACVQRVERALTGLAQSCEIDLATRTAAVRHDPQTVTRRDLMTALHRAGFEPHLLSAADMDHDLDAQDPVVVRRRQLARIGIGVLGAMQVMMFAWPSYSGDVPDAATSELLRWAQLLVATPTVFWAGWPFFAGAAHALRSRTLTMDVPVALSLAIAWSASVLRTVQGGGFLYFDTATMFVALLLIGRYLESATRAKATERLRQLADAAPQYAQRIHGDRVETVSVAHLRRGDAVRVVPGEPLPVDGTLQTTAELDEALVTGESRPVLRRPGESVLAGSISLSRHVIEMRVQATGDGTRVAGILRLLQRAAFRKPRVQTLADRIAGHFTLAVLVLAGLGGLLASSRGVDASLSVVIAVLVASCPCALSLAVPAALAAATSRLASRGVLVARADRLLRLADVDVVLMDKTGTLTESSLSIARCHTLRAISESAARSLAAALESGIAHPIARALAEDDVPHIATDLVVETGRGVRGVIDGNAYQLYAASEDVQGIDGALTWVTLSDDRGPLAHFGLGAPLRPQAAAAVGRLRKAGLEVQLVTGDGPEAAATAGRRAGIQTLVSRQSPEDKLARLRALQRDGRVVLAVGDGLNDAPLLAAADVSASMSKGSGATQAHADLVLVDDRLDALVVARDVASQVRRRVRENLGWAMAYNLAVLPPAFLGELPPWMAAAGMSLSSLVVVVNALRLRLPARS